LRKNSIQAALKGRDFQSRRKTPNNINSRFSRRIEYSTREGVFPQPLQPCRREAAARGL
jgi:hypothetical protein